PFPDRRIATHSLYITLELLSLQKVG
uniref:Uncharacterized protein n=1 Tax=Loxodonta africana TaxID=9785 RepID=G3TS90_LOXAF